MRHETFNEAGETDVVFVLGWGNRIEHRTVQWLVDRLVEADYRVTVFEIPTVVTDFDAEYVAPVADHVADLDGYRLLTHSTGGLIAEFLEGAETRVYLSPWWGFHEDLQNPVVALATKLPISTPILPAGIEREALGEYATAQQIEDVPSRAAPTFLREAKRAQERLPPFEGDAIFYSPTDAVVGVDAIRERAPEEVRVPYEGGHELFGSATRAQHVDTVLDALERGRAALD